MYVSGFFDSFELKAASYNLRKHLYRKGDILTDKGIINNSSHFICSGLVNLSLIHSSGSVKSIMFFGPGTVFPLGVVPHENIIDYQMVMTALTDTTAYKFSYPMLRKMCVDDGAFAAKILEENCRIIGCLFYNEMNNSFLPSEIRVCDTLFLLLDSFPDNHNCIHITQEDLRSLAGISSAQLERVLRDLRSKKIIRTLRGNR